MRDGVDPVGMFGLVYGMRSLSPTTPQSVRGRARCCTTPCMLYALWVGGLCTVPPVGPCCSRFTPRPARVARATCHVSSCRRVATCAQVSRVADSGPVAAVSQRVEGAKQALASGVDTVKSKVAGVVSE